VGSLVSRLIQKLEMACVSVTPGDIVTWTGQAIDLSWK
jgi:plastocyanin